MLAWKDGTYKMTLNQQKKKKKKGGEKYPQFIHNLGKRLLLHRCMKLVWGKSHRLQKQDAGYERAAERRKLEKLPKLWCPWASMPEPGSRST